jgi:hypothetical protein
MSDDNQPAVNIGVAESVTIDPSSDQPSAAPADAPQQETPETEPQPSFTADPSDFKKD